MYLAIAIEKTLLVKLEFCTIFPGWLLNIITCLGVADFHTYEGFGISCFTIWNTPNFGCFHNYD